MGFERDAACIKAVMADRDPAFAAAPAAQLAEAVAAMERAAGDAHDTFLLAAMRAVACGRNGHSRLLPNAAISVLPLRCVMRDGALGIARDLRFCPLVAVNGVPVETLRDAFAPYLAGTRMRAACLSGIMLVWPAALALGSVSGPRYAFELAGGDSLEFRNAKMVPALPLYPVADTGALRVGEDPYALLQGALVHFEQGVWRVRISDLKTLSDAEIEHVVRTMGGAVDAPVILDLRGNPGGSFLTALPLVWWLRDVWRGARCAVLVNGYTFSAAIVTAALVSFHLGPRAAFLGAEMGDDLAFWAEGDTLALPQSGAALRYSTQWHDWRDGQFDGPVPDEWGQWMVGAGDIDVRAVPEAAQWQAALAWVHAA